MRWLLVHQLCSTVRFCRHQRLVIYSKNTTVDSHCGGALLCQHDTQTPGFRTRCRTAFKSLNGRRTHRQHGFVLPEAGVSHGYGLTETGPARWSCMVAWKT
ncbi:hypothetical protein CUMW_139370 [Citrus unshiu]|uniref:Uncharacterized protein n=1 Tax=Citrus unshiu TaxID=55188 RepID=A0A2H5PID5_CITUN|nr:hypothetical protein CUMW_139370 [Citrus unshiu]